MTGLPAAAVSFLVLFVSGYPLAVLLLRNGRRDLRLVLAPLLGLCLDVLLLYLLGVHGNLPVRRSAIVLAAAVLGLNIFAAVRERSYFRPGPQETGPFLAAFVYLALLSAPFFVVGPDHMSIWNEDAYGYIAVADHLKDHTLAERIDPRLVSEHFVYERVDRIVRFHFRERYYRIGPELQLSLASVLLGGDTRRLFFPVLISLAMLMPLGLFLFLEVFGFPRRTALAALFLLPFFSFHYFGFVAQLLAQAAGIPVVLACYWAGTRAFCSGRRAPDLAGLSILLIGLALIYIEAAGLLVPAVLAGALQWIRGKRRFASDMKTALLVLLAAAAFFNVKCKPLIEYEIEQSGLPGLFLGDAAEAARRPVLFPYFLIETGVPAVWGLTAVPFSAWPLAGAPAAILIAVFLFAGILFAVGIRGVVRFPFSRRTLWRATAGFLVAAAGAAFIARRDYLLFKLALWSQFFLCATLWAGWRSIPGRRRAVRAAAGAGLLLLAAANAVNIAVLFRAGLGKGPVWVEWPGAAGRDPLGKLAAVKPALDPGEPLTAVVPGFQAARWASYVLKDFRVRFLVNHGRENFRTVYEGRYAENGWPTRRLLLVDEAEDIFRNRVPGKSVIRDAGYFLIADARRIGNYLLPVSTRRGVIYPAHPGIAAVIGWYPYEIHPGSPWAFDRRGFRWVENNSAFLLKNVTGESLRIKLRLEAAPGVEPLPMRLEFGGRTILDTTVTAQARILSEPFRPRQDGLGRIVFLSPGVKIDARRIPRLIHKDLGSDDRIVNARIGTMEIVFEEEVNRPGYFWGGDRFVPADMERDDFCFAGLYPDGWTAPTVLFFLDLRGRRTLRYRIYVPDRTAPAGFVLDARIDGWPAARFPVPGPGETVFDIPIPPGAGGRSRVEISADRDQPIGPRDPRRTAYMFREAELLR